jgi:hypothetical protein
VLTRPVAGLAALHGLLTKIRDWACRCSRSATSTLTNDQPDRPVVPAQTSAGSYTLTWRQLAAVNGSPFHPPHRSRSRRPAMWAMRSNSGG